MNKAVKILLLLWHVLNIQAIVTLDNNDSIIAVVGPTNSYGMNRLFPISTGMIPFIVDREYRD